MIKNRKKILLLAFISLYIFLPTFAGAEDVALQLRWHHQFQFAGYYMAAEKNFYREEGLAVKIRSLRPSLNPVTEVIRKRAHFGIGSTGLLLERASGRPVVALASLFQHSPLVFIARRDSGIQNIRDIAGKRVMLGEGNQDFELMVLLKKTGMDKKVTLLPSSTNALDLAEKKTDLFNAYLSNEPYLLEMKNIPVSIINPKNYGIDFYGDILFTSQSLVKKNPSMVERFRRASLKGWRYALQHPEEAIGLIKRKYKSTKSKSALRYEANIVREMMLSDIVEIGHMNLSRWEKIQAHLASLNILEKPVALESFLYTPPRSLNWGKLLPWIIAAILLIFTSLVFGIIQLQASRRLKKALNDVKTLSGLLPICSSCKKIRDDSGYWQQIEHYISLRSEADFSHSLCPDCASRLYPDVDYDKMLITKITKK